jgi:hypothetical protein
MVEWSVRFSRNCWHNEADRVQKSECLRHSRTNIGAIDRIPSGAMRLAEGLCSVRQFQGLKPTKPEDSKGERLLPQAGSAGCLVAFQGSKAFSTPDNAGASCGKWRFSMVNIELFLM